MAARSRPSLRKPRFHGRENLAPRARQVPRDRGLVLFQHAANRRQRQAVSVIAGRVAGDRAVERSYGRRERKAQHFHIPGAARIRGSLPCYRRGRRIIFCDRLGAARCAQAIDVALREHRAQPSAEPAAAMKIAEKRLTHAVAFGEAEQVGEQRVRQLARAAARVDRIGCTKQAGTVCGQEMIPGRFEPLCARRSQREILHVHRVHIARDLCLAWVAVLERLGDAFVDGRVEFRARQAPRRAVHRSKSAVSRAPVRAVDEAMGDSLCQRL